MTKEKRDKIKQTRLETEERRKSQVCKTYILKLDKSHLSKQKRDQFRKLFLEVKWLYNYILSQEDVFSFDTKTKAVEVLNKDREKEKRELTCIPAQVKQGIYGRICNSIVTLSKSKKKGNKVGHLKFRSRVDSIPFPQYGNSHWVEGGHLKLTGFGRKYFRVLGVEQLNQEKIEFANAELVRKQDDYYFHITCYLPKRESIFEEEAVGIDFGIKDSLVLSNGEKFSLKVPITSRTKRLQGRFKNKEKNSSNWYRLRQKVQKSYQETTNKKKDIRNKIVSHITNTWKVVCVQDESIKQWQKGLFGRSIQSSMLGGIMSDLKTKSHTLSIVDKWYPSTKLCPVCGRRNRMDLDQREYVCECGYRNDRDIHAAQNILGEGLKHLVPREPRDLIKPVEIRTSGLLSFIGDSLSSWSEKQEASC